MVDQEQKETKQEKVVAYFDKDTRRFHKYLIDAGEEITGNIYFAKEGERIPDELVIILKAKRQ